MNAVPGEDREFYHALHRIPFTARDKMTRSGAVSRYGRPARNRFRRKGCGHGATDETISLCETTTNAAICSATGRSAGSFAVALTHGVLRSISRQKLRLVGFSLLGLAGLAGFLSDAGESRQSEGFASQFRTRRSP